MSSDVNSRRAYNASNRQEQARRNRLAVLAAARERFLRDGYARTTIAAIAADAGVSVETVYKAFGNKPGLVKALFDVAIVGDDEPIPLMQREFVARNRAEPDPRRKLAAYGEHLAEVAPRANPVQLVVRDAAVSDEAAAEVWRQLGAERLAGMTAFATHLHESGHLQDGIGVEDARDVLWTLSSFEIWDLLVNQRGWPVERYGAWVGEQLIAALLPAR
jgi:AcrR family transcriptional regulator